MFLGKLGTSYLIRFSFYCAKERSDLMLPFQLCTACISTFPFASRKIKPAIRVFCRFWKHFCLSGRTRTEWSFARPAFRLRAFQRAARLLVIRSAALLVETAFGVLSFSALPCGSAAAACLTIQPRLRRLLKRLCGRGARRARLAHLLAGAVFDALLLGVNVRIQSTARPVSLAGQLASVAGDGFIDHDFNCLSTSASIVSTFR